ncbi:MAG: asparagine synthase (glutamine-hydrolyzing) [Deltaproteobacteria bacterium]|nr:asparagine synthase (glutamine-hydrolyzing) [Deltaproteobacteria bacterium]
MCGIVGLYSFDHNYNFSEKHEQLSKMASLLSHRGPENMGTYFGDRLFLGQTRLKILDLSIQANQPLSNENETIYVAVNGEIYNYKELREELESKGHRFKSQGDSETIVHLYEEKGEEFVKYLDGMFALALWDSNKRTLIVARDRTGKKPLFFYHQRGIFAFASEIKSFLALQEVDLSINESMYPYYFLHGYVPSPSTIYKSIDSLLPGTYLKMNERTISHHSYWDPSQLYLNKNTKISYSQSQSQLKELINQAVFKRLMADVPLGIFLSGGIDSSIVCTVAHHLLERPLKCFSVGFEGAPSFDETTEAKLIARQCGAEHFIENLKSEMVPKMIDELIWHYDQPYADSSALPSAFVSYLAKEHVSVVLTGDGGDEFFSGYNRFSLANGLERLPLYLQRFIMWTLAQIIKYKKMTPAHQYYLKRLTGCFGLTSSEILNKLASYFYDDLDQLLNKSLRDCDKQLQYSPYRKDLEGMPLLSQLLYLNMKTYLLDDLNVKVDRASMKYALETRAPFQDWRLMEFCMSLPDTYLLKFFNKKKLLKETFRRDIPSLIINKKKKGFGVPLGIWFRTNLRSFILEEMQNLASIEPVVQIKYVRKLLTEHDAGIMDHSQKIWNILMFKKWKELSQGWRARLYNR